MPLNLSKGQKVSLTKGNPGLKKIMVGLGWDVNAFDSGSDFDLDASAFLVGTNGKCPTEREFIFYGNLEHSSGAVKHMGDNLTGEGEGDDEQRKKDQDDQKAVVKPASGYFFCGQPDTSRYSLVKVCRDYSDTLHLYPYPQTVVRYLGLEGSSSIFMRRRRMLTSTILTSPK